MPDQGREVVVGLDNGGTAINATVLDCTGRFLVDRLVETPSRVGEGPAVAIEALNDPEPLMVWQALWSLARMEKEAQKALPQIEKIAADDKNEQVREAAKKAIEVIKGK